MIEITDEMVERALNAPHFGRPGTDAQQRKFIRGMLNAAINPPPDPEIVVTADQIDAAGRVRSSYSPNDIGGAHWHGYIVEVYRAMRRLEPASMPYRATVNYGPAARNHVQRASINRRGCSYVFRDHLYAWVNRNSASGPVEGSRKGDRRRAP